MHDVGEVMVKEMVKKMEPRVVEPLTDKEMRAYKAWCKVMGGDSIPLRFSAASAADVVDAGLKAVEEYVRAKTEHANK